jgi:integral membrane sensor domain MASE1
MPLRRILVLAAFTLLYYVAGRLGLSLAFVNASASPLWPPTGLAIAACLLLGTWVWPAVLAGAFIVNITTTQAVVPSILIACGNTAEALIAAWLAQRTARGADAFSRTTGILAYVGAALVATSVAATVGIVALLIGNLAEPAAAQMIWLTWWTGDLSSAILLTPAIVAVVRRGGQRWTPQSILEAVAVLAAAATAAFCVFGPTVAGVRSYPLMFVTLPVLLWASLRFGLIGAASAVLVTGAVASVGTLHGLGPFARGTPNEALLLLQAYLDVKMVVMLTLAAEVAARRRVERDIRQLNQDLEQRIEARSEDLRRLHGRLVEAQHVARIGSWEWDMLTDTIWWSDELYGLYGLAVGSPITFERYLSMVHPDDRGPVQQIVGASARSGEPFAFEHRAVRPDGTVVTLHSRGRVVIDAGGRAVRMLGIGHDVTERKRAEEERLQLVSEQAARREAEESNRMKDYFLATLSHELRNADQRHARLGAGAAPGRGGRGTAASCDRRDPAERPDPGAARVGHPGRRPVAHRQRHHRRAAGFPAVRRRRGPRHHAAGHHPETHRSGNHRRQRHLRPGRRAAAAAGVLEPPVECREVSRPARPDRGHREAGR